MFVCVNYMILFLKIYFGSKCVYFNNLEQYYRKIITMRIKYSINTVTVQRITVKLYDKKRYES